jgi:hypothetical protein
MLATKVIREYKNQSENQPSRVRQEILSQNRINYKNKYLKPFPDSPLSNATKDIRFKNYFQKNVAAITLYAIDKQYAKFMYIAESMEELTKLASSTKADFVLVNNYATNSLSNKAYAASIGQKSVVKASTGRGIAITGSFAYYGVLFNATDAFASSGDNNAVAAFKGAALGTLTSQFFSNLKVRFITANFGNLSGKALMVAKSNLVFQSKMSDFYKGLQYSFPRNCIFSTVNEAVLFKMAKFIIPKEFIENENTNAQLKLCVIFLSPIAAVLSTPASLGVANIAAAAMNPANENLTTRELLEKNFANNVPKNSLSAKLGRKVGEKLGNKNLGETIFKTVRGAHSMKSLKPAAKFLAMAQFIRFIFTDEKSIRDKLKTPSSAAR